MMIVRKTYPELKANHIRPLKKLLGIGTKGCLVKYNDSEKLMTFPNGSTILFAYCDTESDTDRYQGTEIHILFLDEATQLSQKQIEDLNACVRSTDENMPLRTYYTCNPGGKGHAYIKRLFVDRIFVGKEKPEQYSFIQSLVYDNEILLDAHPEYLDALENLPEAKRKAWLMGDWNSFVGQAFPEFRHDPTHYQDRRWTHVIDNLDTIPEDWKIYRGFDFGYRKPFAVVWIGIQPASNRMYLFKEWYGCTDTPNTGIELTAQEIADGITVREKTDPRLKGRKIYGIADKAIWIKDGAGESIAEMMEQRRVYFEPSDSARLAGKMQMHYRLRFDDMGLPMFYVCKECKDFIRTFPLLLYDEKKTEDIDTELEDHCVVGETVVQTPGKGRCIKDLIDTIGYVISSDGKPHRYHDVRMTQKNVDVFKITMDNGKSVTATPNHRFMLADGTWKRLDELELGDELMEVSDGNQNDQRNYPRV